MDTIKVLYQDDDILAVNKPAGLLVHSSLHQSRQNEATLVDWLRTHHREVEGVGDPTGLRFRPGIVHRLDRDTSGVMVVALSQRGFVVLKKQFQDRTVKKEYVAILRGSLKEKETIITSSIGIKPGTTKRTVFSTKHAKKATTLVKREMVVKKNGEMFTLAHIFPKTGRTHQIRVHCNSIHHPVVGDQLYGGKTNALSAPRMLLHAWRININTPDGKPITITSPIPKSLTNFVKEGTIIEK